MAYKGWLVELVEKLGLEPSWFSNLRDICTSWAKTACLLQKKLSVISITAGVSQIGFQCYSKCRTTLVLSHTRCLQWWLWNFHIRDNHLVWSQWDTVIFLISMSHHLSSNFDINVPNLSHPLNTGSPHIWQKAIPYIVAYIFIACFSKW